MKPDIDYAEPKFEPEAVMDQQSKCPTASRLSYARTPLKWRQILPSNGAGRRRTVTPNMLAALRDELVDSPCMRLKDMVAFLRTEFDADVTRFSVSRVLRSVDYTMKVTRNVAKERKPDLRGDHMVWNGFEELIKRTSQLFLGKLFAS